MRSWPVPPSGDLIHFIGDPHFGAIDAARVPKMQADLTSRFVPTPDVHVCIGDMANTPVAGENTAALAFLNALDAPWYAISGNHDLWDNVQTKDQVAAIYGNPTPDYTVDRGFVKLVCLSYDVMRSGDNGTQWLNDSQVAWLDSTLAASSKPCIVVCHCPLKDTVLGDPAVVFSSSTSGFYIRSGLFADDDTLIRSVLAARPSCIGWVSGHTHSPLDTPGLATQVTVGTRTMFALNVGALPYLGKTAALDTPIVSPYVNVFSDHVDIRWRDHGAGIWYGPNGVRVATVSFG